MYRTSKASDVMAQSVVVTHFVTELVAQRVVERHDAAAARTAVSDDAVRVFARAVVSGQLSSHVGMTVFSFAGRAVDAVIGVVDAVRNQLLADALPHRTVVPVPLAGIEFDEHRSVRQHHFAQMERRVLAYDQSARRHRLEVLAMSRGILRELKPIARRNEHPQVDRVQQQLGRRADLEVA